MKQKEKIEKMDALTKLSSVKTKELSFWKNLGKQAFLIWDGLKFFGFQFDKLPRLRGKKKSFTDKLQNRKHIASFIIILVLTLWVILAEFS